MARRFICIGGALAGLVVLAIAALVAITLIRSDDPNLRTEAPAIPTTAAPAQSGTDLSNATAPDLPSGVLRFVIDSAGSEVKYVVRETLRGVVGSNAVGTTNAITGAIYLTPDGLSTAVQSEFNVDLRELRTDESRRDRYMRNNVLDTRQFPFAAFAAESITGFPAGYVEGEEVSLTLNGQLTVHGVNNRVDWVVKVRRAGDTLTAIADTDFNMSDFGITPPNVQVAKAEDGVHLQATILVRIAS